MEPYKPNDISPGTACGRRQAIRSEGQPLSDYLDFGIVGDLLKGARQGQTRQLLVAFRSQLPNLGFPVWSEPCCLRRQRVEERELLLAVEQRESPIYIVRRSTLFPWS